VLWPQIVPALIFVATAKDLVKKLLVVNPKERLTVVAAKEHAFLQVGV
jgi:hypothetical protein